MGTINNYKNFLLEKDEDKSKVKGKGKRTTAKVKRIVTGDHVGFDPKVGNKYPLTYLPEEKFNKLVEYWKAGDKNKAAEFLRGIIIKERDAQFKVGAALIMVGATMVKAGFPVEDITPENTSTTNVTPDITPELTEHTTKVLDGEGVTQIVQRESGVTLNGNATAGDLMGAIKKTFGGGDLTTGIDNISSASKNPQDIIDALKDISDVDPSSKLSDVLVGKFKGTGETLGDLLDTVAGNEVTYYK
jgi:hypothetical protein